MPGARRNRSEDKDDSDSSHDASSIDRWGGLVPMDLHDSDDDTTVVFLGDENRICRRPTAWLLRPRLLVHGLPKDVERRNDMDTIGRIEEAVMTHLRAIAQALPLLFVASLATCQRLRSRSPSGQGIKLGSYESRRTVRVALPSLRSQQRTDRRVVEAD